MHTVIRTGDAWAVVFIRPDDDDDTIERRPLECFEGKREAYEFCSWLNGGPTPRQDAIDALQRSKEPDRLEVSLRNMTGY
jgi:hypothetical protein